MTAQNNIILINSKEDFDKYFEEIIEIKVKNAVAEIFNNNILNNSEFINIKEAEKLLHVQRTTIYNYVKNNYFATYKVGGKKMFKKAEILSYMNKQKIENIN
jgi:excisionase family DNA binding protein